MYKHLTREQRYAIYLGLQKHETNKAIAQAIKVSESTVSREIRRNATRNGKYLWNTGRRECNAQEMPRSGQSCRQARGALAGGAAD